MQRIQMHRGSVRLNIHYKKRNKYTCKYEGKNNENRYNRNKIFEADKGISGKNCFKITPLTMTLK